jgi:hypothetical protein
MIVLLRLSIHVVLCPVNIYCTCRYILFLDGLKICSFMHAISIVYSARNSGKRYLTFGTSLAFQNIIFIDQQSVVYWVLVGFLVV